jgi:hypothetical protein
MKLKAISLTRAEGPTAVCGPAPTVTTWQAAEDILRKWSDTAPEKGGYDKCDFTLVFGQADGEDFEYKGRYDLKHWRCEAPSLTAHLQSEALFAIGAYCPAHLTEAQYQHFREDYYDESTKQFYAELLATTGLLEGESSVEDLTQQAYQANFCRELEDGSVFCYVWTNDTDLTGVPGAATNWTATYRDRDAAFARVGSSRDCESGTRVLAMLNKKVIL